MADSSKEKKFREKTLGLFQKLLFDSSWDFLKAGIIGGLLFLWGNFLGLLYEPPRSLNIDLLPMGDYFEGYGFVSIVFDDFEADTDHKMPLSFDPPALRQMRVCDELSWDDTGRGLTYLKRLVDEYPRCLKLEILSDGGSENARISRSDDAELLRSISRDGLDHWFCGCDERVLETFAANRDYP